MQTDKKAFYKQYFNIALPVMVQQLQTQLVTLCGTAMLGVLSEHAISGASIANKIYFIYSLGIMGLTNGVGIFITQYYGAGDKRTYNQIFRFGLFVNAILGVVVSVLAFLFAPQLIMLFVKNPVVIEYGVEYLKITSLSYIPAAITPICALFLRTTGRAETPMKVGFITLFINLGLNYALIFGKLGLPALGVVGAALATTIARFIEAVLFIVVIAIRKEEGTFQRNLGRLHKETISLILKKSLPLVLNELVWSSALSIVFMNYCYVNEAFIPAITVVDSVCNLVYSIFTGCTTTSGILIGNYLGAGELGTAKTLSSRMIKINMSIFAIGNVCLMLFSGFVPRLFSLTGDLAIATTHFLIIKATIDLVRGFPDTVYSILRAGGDMKGVLTMDGLFVLVFPMLISIVFSRFIPLPLTALYALVEGSTLLKVGIAAKHLKKERWLVSLNTQSANAHS